MKCRDLLGTFLLGGEIYLYLCGGKRFLSSEQGLKT